MSNKNKSRGKSHNGRGHSKSKSKYGGSGKHRNKTPGRKENKFALGNDKRCHMYTTVFDKACDKIQKDLDQGAKVVVAL